MNNVRELQTYYFVTSGCENHGSKFSAEKYKNKLTKSINLLIKNLGTPTHARNRITEFSLTNKKYLKLFGMNL